MARDAEMQTLRMVASDRRLVPALTHFGDHLTPAVLLSMNTGLRRGEVLELRWACVDFNPRLLTVEGRTSSVAMSLRYAHLAPDQPREGVAKLNETPILALTLRVPWESPQAMCRYPIVCFRAHRLHFIPST